MELPHVEKLYRELEAQGFGLVTLTQDPAADVRKLVDYNGITHPMVSDVKDAAGGSVYKAYHAYDGKHYLIASDGTILAAFSKLGVSLPILRRAVAKYGVGTGTAGRPGAQDPAAAERAAVAWSGVATPATAGAGARVSVALGATVQAGWHIYAIGQRPGGPVPLRIAIGEGQPFALAGDIKSPPPDVHFDPGFGIDVQELTGELMFIVPIAVAPRAPSGTRGLKVDVRYQACNGAICLPVQTDTIRVPLTVSGPRSGIGGARDARLIPMTRAR